MAKRKPKQLISAWLNDNSDGHSMHEFIPFAGFFKKDTGSDLLNKLPKSYIHTVKEMRKALKLEGRGGYVQGDDDTLLVCGQDISRYIAASLKVEYEGKMGRGFQFRAIIEALAKAGY